jgi:hypothetical protein
MQAIITTYKFATNTRGSRILARCTRGSISVSYDHEPRHLRRTTSQPRKLSSTDSSRKTSSPAPNRPAATHGTAPAQSASSRAARMSTFSSTNHHHHNANQTCKSFLAYGLDNDRSRAELAESAIESSSTLVTDSDQTPVPAAHDEQPLRAPAVSAPP